MTPFQFKCCVEAYADAQISKHNQKVWFMWHGAALARVKEMPSIKKFFTSDKKQVKHIDETAIIARMKAYNQRLENDSTKANS